MYARCTFCESIESKNKWKWNKMLHIPWTCPGCTFRRTLWPLLPLPPLSSLRNASIVWTTPGRREASSVAQRSGSNTRPAFANLCTGIRFTPTTQARNCTLCILWGIFSIVASAFFPILLRRLGRQFCVAGVW